MAPVLVTGFEPFGGHPSNPSSAVAQAVARREANGLEVVSVELPVDGSAAPARLRALLDDLRPAAVLMLGLAEGRPQPSLERVAVNLLDYPIPDNSGVSRRGEPVVDGAPPAYFSSLPLDAVLEAWRRENLPGYLSDTAGTYLCNQVFYTARHHLSATGRAPLPAGFLHLPCDESLALARPRPYVPLESQVRSVAAALDAITRRLEGA
ncbi:MAG TPA: pyrrolidone-carboxylate peptidase [Deinococcales bacterium]|nr:pyrrolidone-carboxylate peptidase [Deinococcales bacterium]